MNKVMMLLLVILFISVGSASAADSANGQLSLTGIDGTGATVAGMLVIGLSPKVVMYEVTSGATITSSQWFAISAGHPGGNRCYGTAQDVNNIYYQEYNTAAELSTYLEAIPTTSTASNVWGDEGWAM